MLHTANMFPKCRNEGESNHSTCFRNEFREHLYFSIFSRVAVRVSISESMFWAEVKKCPEVNECYEDFSKKPTVRDSDFSNCFKLECKHFESKFIPHCQSDSCATSLNRNMLIMNSVNLALSSEKETVQCTWREVLIHGSSENALEKISITIAYICN